MSEVNKRTQPVPRVYKRSQSEIEEQKTEQRIRLNLRSMPRFEKVVPKSHFANESICHMCSEKFNFSTKRHHWQFWGKSVCSKHSYKSRELNGEQCKIWDKCDKIMIEREVLKDFEFQMLKVNKEIHKKRQQLEDHKKKSFQDDEKIKRLEVEVQKRKEKLSEREEANQKQLSDDRDKVTQTVHTIKHLKEAVIESQHSERQVLQQNEKLLRNYDLLKSELSHEEHRRADLCSQLDVLNKKRVNMLTAQQIESTL